ncbi:MAG: DnaJ domain-containing protein [Candidatus Rokubacteria bacterium]|nr:DnaJ domain-containing protein [Candidatus Rokubacteria bacterium]
MEYRDYYKILGVDRAADDKAIKTAYRKLARKHHPDVSRGSADKFKEINEAYDVLSDPEKRRRYDTLGSDWERFAHAHAGQAPPGQYEVRFETGGDAAGFSEFFRAIFGDLGGGSVRDRRRGSRVAGFDIEDVDLGGGVQGGGQDIEAEIEISLEDAFRGAKKTVALQLDEPCPTCGGSGHQNRKPCPRCQGTGWSRGQRHLEVKIPAGVDNSSRVRVAREGAGGVGGGRRGDLYLRVRVIPDARFERRGDDLHTEIQVLAPDAALGTEIQVPTLKGQVSMKIPPETSGGRTFRLPGYGMPRLKGGGAGDEYVKVQIAIPPGLTPREKELYAELQRLRARETR